MVGSFIIAWEGVRLYCHTGNIGTSYSDNPFDNRTQRLLMVMPTYPTAVSILTATAYLTYFPMPLPDGVFGSDVPDDGDAPDSGFRLLSLRTIIAFLTIFGWVGLITLKQGLPTAWSLIISFAGGFVAMLLVALAVSWMMRFQTDGTRNIGNALGKSGTVYLRIPANREGNGKVNLMLQDTFVELDAVTDEENEIPSGREVVVIGLSGQSTLVVKSK